jgi:EAL domain-containing protein (putative c-di-GMP-specific phosphodiesterase class I)
MNWSKFPHSLLITLTQDLCDRLTKKNPKDTRQNRVLLYTALWMCLNVSPYSLQDLTWSHLIRSLDYPHTRFATNSLKKPIDTRQNMVLPYTALWMRLNVSPQSLEDQEWSHLIRSLDYPHTRFVACSLEKKLPTHDTDLVLSLYRIVNARRGYRLHRGRKIEELFKSNYNCPVVICIQRC